MDMRSVSRDIHYACFRFGLIAGLNARKRIPEESREASPLGMVALGSPAQIEEWIAGDPPETVARKVLACQSAEYWVRADLADEALRRIAAEELERERVIAKLSAWRDEQDQHNATRRGMSLEAYRRERNAQGHRQVMRSGINSIGMH